MASAARLQFGATELVAYRVRVPSIEELARPGKSPAPSARRRRLVALALAGAIVVSGIAGLAFVLAHEGGGGNRLTRATYLTRVSAICHWAGAKLDRIPPIQDPTLLGEVIASVDAALPILKDQRDRAQAIPPPPALRLEVARFLVLTDRSLGTLQSVKQAAATMNVARVAIGLERFGAETTRAKLVARRIGYRC